MKINKLSTVFLLFSALFVCTFCLPGSAFARQQTDSLGTLSFENFLSRVLETHPKAKNARLYPEAAAARLQSARGAFDPKLAGSFDEKSFAGKNYYTHRNLYLGIPTGLGADFKAGFEKNTGTYLSQENDTNKGKGLFYAGFSIPLGPLASGFMIDERRAGLRKAKIGLTLADAEQAGELSELAYKAAAAYWDWYFADRQYQLLDGSIRLADTRYRAVIQAVKSGFEAGIDSVEAKITLQQRQAALFEAETELFAAKNAMQVFLTGSSLPLSLDKAPDRPADSDSLPDLEKLTEIALRQHPYLSNLRLKTETLKIEKALAKEGLKPELRLKYNVLAGQTEPALPGGTDLFTENYKVGLELAFPLFLRKSRGKLSELEIKKQQNENKTVLLESEIAQDLPALYRKTENYLAQIRVYTEAVDYYERLYRAEISKFQQGYSSLFYVNVREGKMLEARIKLESLHAKFEAGRAKLYYAAGMLPPGFEF